MVVSTITGSDLRYVRFERRDVTGVAVVWCARGLRRGAVLARKRAIIEGFPEWAMLVDAGDDVN